MLTSQSVELCPGIGLAWHILVMGNQPHLKTNRPQHKSIKIYLRITAGALWTLVYADGAGSIKVAADHFRVGGEPGTLCCFLADLQALAGVRDAGHKAD